MSLFQLNSSYDPTWDQPKAIDQIVQWFNKGSKVITLLWATWTWKTFTMANVINKLQKPTLVISHNKTLAAQLATEFKYFFPQNAVHYFVSYFDYYQPESYLPDKDIYIEKESTINKEIEMYRLSTMASLLSREDVVVVSSVSALYGLWSKEIFQKNVVFFEVGKTYDFTEIKRKLISMQYKSVQSKIEAWMFDFRWEILDIYSSVDNVLYRMIFDEETLEMIEQKEATTFRSLWTMNKVAIWPANQFLQDMSELDEIFVKIEHDLEERVKELKAAWKELEANRLFKKTMYDIRMIKETWFTNWIENYSPYFDRRLPGQPPSTLFDYFPDDFLIIIDESHMSIPQLRAMHNWDRSRKTNLIEHWFRLPSAIDHRPLRFDELETILGIWKTENEYVKTKSNAKALFVSATPWEYESKNANIVAEQIIRPTWLLDPITYIYPKSWDYKILIDSLSKLLLKKDFLKKYLNNYSEKITIKEIFLGWDL